MVRTHTTSLERLARLDRRWRILCAVAAVIIVGLALGLWYAATRSGPAPRARQYLDFTACLLTDPQGVSSPSASKVWSAMQDASVATHVRVQYRSLGGATTGDEAAAYLSSMALARCGLLFVIDTGAASAADRVAPKFPQARFYVVGGGHAGRNVVTLRGSTDEVAAQVRRAIVDAAPH